MVTIQSRGDWVRTELLSQLNNTAQPAAVVELRSDMNLPPKKSLAHSFIAVYTYMIFGTGPDTPPAGVLDHLVQVVVSRNRFWLRHPTADSGHSPGRFHSSALTNPNTVSVAMAIQDRRNR